MARRKALSNRRVEEENCFCVGWLLYQLPAFRSHGPGRWQGWGRPRAGRGRRRGVWAVECVLASLVVKFIVHVHMFGWLPVTDCAVSSLYRKQRPTICLPTMRAHAQISSLSRNSEETNAVWLWRDGCVMRNSICIFRVSAVYACQPLASVFAM